MEKTTLEIKKVNIEVHTPYRSYQSHGQSPPLQKLICHRRRNKPLNELILTRHFWSCLSLTLKDLSSSHLSSSCILDTVQREDDQTH